MIDRWYNPLERRTTLRCLAVCTAIVLLASTDAAGQLRSAADARRAMSELLKISPEPPAVDVEVVSRRVEDDLIVEDLAWPSLDGQRAVATLIRPAKGGRRPAVVCLHGTGGSRDSETTREFGPGDWTRPGANEPHRRMLGWARELAKRGFVTLSLTQRGLDRRSPPDTNDQAKDLLVRGRTLMGAIVHEIRQAVTHLEKREDVIASQIGLTGMSFGGITSFYTWVTDSRIAAAASICGGVGSIDALLREGRPSYHGFYWWIPDMLTRGDQGDFAAALAPQPLMLWAPQSDIGMPKAGVDRFAATVRPAYARANAASSLEIHQPQGEHEFTFAAFEAMTSFFEARFRMRRE
jgi:dienelactone hydrolase